MAAYTTSQAGNWSSTSTWDDSGPPGDGDTATVAHAVTVDTNTTVGTSPAAGNVVLTCTADLTIATGVQLTLRGDATLNNCGIIMASGSTLEFDSSQAASPGDQDYNILVGTDHNQNSAVVDINGTSGSRCTVQSNGSGGQGYFKNGGYLRGCAVQADYTDFSYIGNATNPSMRPWISSSAGKQFWLKHCTFDYCGDVGGNGSATVYNTNEYADYEVEDCNFANGVGSYDLRFGQNAARDSGTWSFQRNAFGLGPYMYGGSGCTFKDNVIGDSFIRGTGFVPTTFEGNFVYETGGGPSANYDMTDCYFLNTDSSNPHPLQSASEERSVTLDGLVIDVPNGDGQGDAIAGGAPSSAYTLTIKNCILLPTSDGEMSCTLVSLLGGANLTVSINHCTSYGQVVVGETYNSHAGMVSSLKSNIFWGDGVETVYKIHNINGSPNDDVVSAANADYNCGHEVTAGSEGGGYNTPMTGSPGSNDVDADPQFVADTRNIMTWDTALGGNGTTANAVAELMKLNTTGHDSNYTVSALLTWVKAGFKVQNSNLENAGHDSVTIGAMGYEAAAETPTGQIVTTVLVDDG